MIILIKKHFSKLLYAKRRERKWTQEKSATRCGKTTKQYFNLEKGNSLPEMETLINLTIIYDIDLNQFVRDLVDDGYKIEDKVCDLIEL